MNLVAMLLVWGISSEVRDDELDRLLRFLIVININFLVELEEGLFAHTTDVNDLLKSLDSVFEDWLDRLHDTESSLHIVDLWLHSLDGLHLSGDLDEWLSIIKSLEDSGGEGLLDAVSYTHLRAHRDS